MKIGLDLDGTIYGFPEFFREFIPAMIAQGHEIYCSSIHTQEQWKNNDPQKLQKLGINPNMINSSLLPNYFIPKSKEQLRAKYKGTIADSLDIVFDDDPKIQQYTKTPIFKCPKKKELNN